MKLSRRVALGATLAAMVLTGASSAFAADSDMVLFKVVTTDKDDVIIGLTESQLAAAGGLDAGTVGKMLVASGELAAWQYVVAHNDAGDLVEAPTNKISIIANAAVRIEPYQAEWPVTLPTAE
ncbi:MAG: hypothetical protein JWP26_513 [Devosia sp.]|uniref:hypothetical protein n=1 Tax=Devosia sp. TaxID=1871048 RepID=UPI00261D19A9|nr:hypothetical protein [Devosia sp.]MDB5536656.1 hypothetical protein [Devosia sp.]MDB5585543.1 hypothetical protein [Devosia sp.]